MSDAARPRQVPVFARRLAKRRRSIRFCTPARSESGTCHAGAEALCTSRSDAESLASSADPGERRFHIAPAPSDVPVQVVLASGMR